MAGFRGMRRFKQELPRERCEEILKKNTSGVLAVLGDEGYPYAVPLSYDYCGGKLYFHSASTGHKLDAITKCDKVSFCVIDKDTVVPEKFTTFFRSVIAFGRARIIEGEEEKRAALNKLAAKYSPNVPGRDEEVEGSLARVAIIELAIEHLSGKEAIELVNAKA